MNKLIEKIKGNKVVKNAEWIIGGRVIQMILSLFIGIITARYLGPSNYGIINYVAAYIAFFTSLTTLGINSIIVKEFSDNPKEQGVAIWSAIILRLVSSILSIIAVMALVSIVDKGDSTIRRVALLSSLALVFQSFDTITYWFQAKLNSKVSSIATLIAYICVSIYRIILLVLNKNVFWFAAASSIDTLVIAILLFISYKRNAGPPLKFNWEKSKDLLRKSYHFILAGLIVQIYSQTDKIMIKQMMDETQVGYYSLGVSICTTWTFVLQAIIDSMYPGIVESYGNKKLFDHRNKQLYMLVFYISVVVSIGITFFGKYIIRILYGDAYLPTASILNVITWYTAFSFLGVARNAWLVCEGKQNYLKWMYSLAVVINIGLNYLMIPIWGASGAALASLITQIGTSIVLPYFFSEIRPNAKLMVDAIFLKDILKKKNK